MNNKPSLKHIACIADGNRRWAQKHNLMFGAGYQEGIKTAERVIDYCIQNHIPYLSLYLFSIENFKRDTKQIDWLFSLFYDYVKTFMHQMYAQGVSVQFIGDTRLIPKRLYKKIQEIEAATLGGTTLQLNLLFCYGAQQELAYAMRAIAKKIERNELSSDSITPSIIQQNLWTAHCPDPDLIIRTAGQKRLSNFLLYQAAYTELYFLDCLWPELTWQDLDQAKNFFLQTVRNKGI